MTGSFVHFFRSGQYHLKYAKGSPSLIGREFHDYHEILLFIEGSAQFISKNIQTTLSPGCVIFIPKEHFHQFIIADPDVYVRCILGFDDIPEFMPLISAVMSEILVITDPSDTILSVFHFLKQVFSKEDVSDEDKKLLLPAALTQLLMEQKHFANQSIGRRKTISDLTTQALSYIDVHFMDPLTVSSISKALYVSTSSLSYHFRNDLNLSIYAYITEKRLSEVRKHISKGLSISEAVTLCGFSDYSCFYRQYKKHYGVKPSDSFR